MKKNYIVLLSTGIVIIVVGYLLLVYLSDRSKIQDDLIRIYRPQYGDVISNPVLVEGEARGYWYFEASFPVKIVDENGKQLGIGIAQAQKEWMTTDFVPFSVNINFDWPATKNGTIILEKDNPSGLPENADERRIPIKFNPN